MAWAVPMALARTPERVTTAASFLNVNMSFFFLIDKNDGLHRHVIYPGGGLFGSVFLK
jgi:hypothetical protein